MFIIFYMEREREGQSNILMSVVAYHQVSNKTYQQAKIPKMLLRSIVCTSHHLEQHKILQDKEEDTDPHQQSNNSTT